MSNQVQQGMEKVRANQVHQGMEKVRAIFTS